MIISKTPYRLSFFGGGTDYPDWLNNNKGAVLSVTIDKYIYISLNVKSSFFHQDYRIVYRKTENKKKIQFINHPSVRECFRHFDLKGGVEMNYMGDLPSKSGMGSSSAFTVGLLNAIYEHKKTRINKKKLALKAIEIEQEIIKENVGSQDQISTSFGGFNLIKFKKSNDFSVKKIEINPDVIKELNGNLLLFYTGIKRKANDIADTYTYKLNSLNNVMNETYDLVFEGHKYLLRGELDKFGQLLNTGWKLKRSLGGSVTNKKIDNIYETAIKEGALGGKLLGAGGGGFFLLYVPKNKTKRVISSLKKLHFFRFNFENRGSHIINSFS